MNNQSNQAGFGKLASLVIALIVAGGGLLLGFRVGQYFFSNSKPAATVKTEDSHSSQEAAVSKADSVTPAPETAIAQPAVKMIQGADLKSSAAADASGDSAKEKAASAQRRQIVEAVAKELPLVKRLDITPPAVSSINRNVMTYRGAPGGLNDPARGNPQAEQDVPAPQQPVRDEPRVPNVIRKSGDVLQNSAAFRPQPVYPMAARAADIKGNVTVEVTINEEGSVIAARAISGPEQLRAAAVAAARRWKWVPTRVDRERARVVGTITFRFND